MDWGIGGFSVYAALRAAGRSDDVVYLSDSGNISYGQLTTAQMRARFLEIARFFRRRDVSEVLVGCNAASSALAGDVEQFEGVKFHSIIPAGVETARSAIAGRIGVIGGELTIASRVYQRLLKGPGFVFQITQPLSSLVERGECEGFRAESAIAEAFEALGAVDALLLACTHYPALANSFHQLRPGITLLDPARRFVDAVAPRPGNARVIFHTTGPGDAVSIVREAFGVTIDEIRLLDLALNEKPGAA